MSNKELRAKLVIEADSKGSEEIIKLQSGLEKLGASAGEAGPEFEALAAELGALGSASTTLGKSQAELGQGLDASRASLERMANEAEAAAAVLADRELLGVRAHADIQKEIDKTKAAYERLKASGKLTGAELAQAALKTEERVRELRQQTNGWTESLGKAKTAFAGLAASGAGIAVAANAAIKFESAMADVAKVADGTNEQMDGLASRIKAMAATIPLAVTELAQIAAAGGQLGVPIEKLDQFIELAATMATAFGMSAEQAGQAVAKLSNVFSLPLTEVRKLGDAINVLGNTTAAREADIVDVLTRIGGTARQFGLTAQQAAALGTAMLSLGVQAEVAGTGINAILSKLQTAGVQSKDFQLALGEMGVSAKQLAEDIRANPQKALSDFLATLSKLEGGKQAEVLARLFGVEYQDDVARLLGGLQGYSKALQSVGSEAATAGAMQKEFETRVKTTEAQIALLKNSVGVLATNLGSVLLPVLKPVIGGLADASNAVAKFAETFPLISAAAAGLVTAAASAGALGLAFAALRVAGTKSIEAIALALPSVTKGMEGAIVATGGLQAALSKMGVVAAGLFVGWDVGTYLRKEFLSVEIAGIRMAQGLTIAAAQYQAAWEMGKAVFNDDTIEAAQERLRVKLAQINHEYAELVILARETKEAQTGQAAAADAAADAAQKQADAQAKSAAATDDAATKAGKLAQEYLAARDGSEGVRGAIEKLVGALNFDEPEGINTLILAMGELADSGRVSANEVSQAWQAAIDRMSTGQMESTLARVRLAYADATISAEQFAQINALVLAESFERLGVNAAQALGSVSAGAQEAIDSVNLVARSAAEAGVGVEAAARSIEMAFAAAIPKADSLEAIDALEKQLKAMGEAGKISAQGVERTQAALDKQRATIEAQIPGIQSLEEALRSLGVKPQKELAALAASAKQAFDAVKASGTATPREISEAWKAMAEASIEANNGVADASIKAQASQYGMVVETDKAGKSIVKSMKEAEAATKDVGKAAVATADSIRELADAGWDATKDIVAQARAHNAALAKVETSWLDATAAASKYSQEMAAVVWAANKSIAAMTAEHARLVQMMEAMARQQQQLEDQGNGAARGVEDLRLRLLELEGTEADIAQARHERDVAEVQRKMALMQLDLQRAQLGGKQDEALRLQAELGLLQEQLKLLDQIFRKEEEQRKVREREGKGGAGGGGGGGGSGGGGLAALAGPVGGSINITLNANGINDPVKLARMIEPELSKMARLAR